MKTKLRIALALFLPVQIIAVRILGHYPIVVESYYSHGIYPVISFVERYAMGWIPFSVGDMLYIAFAIILIRWVYRRFKTRFKKPKVWALQAFSAISVLYFFFHLCWGLNYNRLPLNRSLGIGTAYSQEELIALTKKLIERSNQSQYRLTGNDTIKVDFAFSDDQIREMAVQGYQKLAKTYPYLNYRQGSIKSSLFSIPLTYMGFSGYLNPLTNEAQVNSELPGFSMPTVTTHEMGHQLGYAKENEANFMACLATMENPNPYFRYAGYTFALRYCLSELYMENRKEAEVLSAELNRGVKKNYLALQDFWEAHQNPIEPVLKLFYGHYLKANNQPKGMQSYNYVVALLVNYFQGEHAL